VVSSGKSSAMERGACWVAQIASWGVAGLVRAGLHVLGLVASRDTAVGLAVVGGAGRSGDDGRGAGGVVRRLSHSGVLMLFLKKKKCYRANSLYDPQSPGTLPLLHPWNAANKHAATTLLHQMEIAGYRSRS
jgi:hypothetical protein